MKGDFTRDTFDPRRHFSRVLMQQGRVTLDADHNEQTAILLHYLRTLAKDLIGPFGIPASAEGGFSLSAAGDGHDLGISPGRCYVDGILVENDAPAASWRRQPYPVDDPDELANFLDANGDARRQYLLYLDVWERHLSWIEAGTIRELALGGPDTCTRAQVVWQLRAAAYAGRLPKDRDGIVKLTQEERLRLAGAESDRRAGATLIADLVPLAGPKSACIIAPDSRYRGLENQLYRVEIHASSNNGVFSFKWSRDNGSTATAVVGFEGNAFEVADGRGFEAGIWVEFSFDEHDLLSQPGWLFKLGMVEGHTLFADPDTLPDDLPNTWLEADAQRHPKIRRWDQQADEAQALTDGLIQVSQTRLMANAWFDIEDGIRVAFAPEGEYRCGDYWLIPARVASGDIEWPREKGADGKDHPLAQAPHGIVHHYAALGVVSRNTTGTLVVQQGGGWLG
ncbi:hypothetical protein FNU76_23055 [Chitinimonas arctica]|uniref:Uncharacterized protein n=1 Tax=Chitinimonas arctica TaxID=2594795 RepID=A0A516SLG9_9NEIS|nr:DUF6519 domain-containing protein [Chitinimonas arctica]QDQ28992.1 hypothetical protein FNU76_23055 [Chitinimonas arctica]